MKRPSTNNGQGGFIESVRFIDQDNIDWDEYPFIIPAVLELPKQDLKSPITIFLGENGSGKSTIVEALAGMLDLNPEGGGRGMKFSTAATHSNLWDYIAPNRDKFTREGTTFFLRAETMYNVFTEREYANDPSSDDDLLRNKDFYDENGKYFGPDPKLYRRRDQYARGRMHQMSHGESFFEQLTQFRANGIYILDEPEAALSPSRQLATVKLLHDLAFNQGCQVFLATHSPILAAIPGANILQLSDQGIEKVDYDDCELVRTYWAFMKNPGSFIDRLFRD